MVSEIPLNATLVARDTRLTWFSCNKVVMKVVGKNSSLLLSTPILDAPSCQSYADIVLGDARSLNVLPLEEEGIADPLPG